MEKIKVIIVDDNIQSINSVKNAISKMEDIVIVGEGSNGEDEIELINSVKPDIVFTDNKMPLLNGIDVIEEFKDNEDKPFFVMISGDTDMRFKSIQYNFRYFNKLDNFSKLCGIIEEYKKSKIDNLLNARMNINTKKESFFSRIFR